MRKTNRVNMHRSTWIRLSAIAAFLGVVLLIGGIAAIRYNYDQALKPASSSQKINLVKVPEGASVKDIAKILKDAGLIRQSWAFEWYVRNNSLSAELKAGTYALTPSQGIAEIASILAHGEVATDLVTILPGQRLDQIEATLINDGFSPSDVKQALNPALYKDHPALVDKPKKASLEGYLYPESFQKTSTTSAQDIIRQSLDEMQKRLTPEVRDGFAKRGLNVYQGITLASIVEKEVNTANDRSVVAQVFLRRLKLGMRLESDVTAIYGSVSAGQSPNLSYDSPYNTHLHGGLPPGPISKVTRSSLLAVISPAKSDYLYFVAGDDGRTYFAKTLEGHQQNVRLHCKKLCN